LSGKKLFESDAVRTDAQKVLVLITDKKSTGDSSRAKLAKQQIEEDGVELIVVGVGNEVDQKELVDVATSPDHKITTAPDGDPDDTADKIIDIINKGKVYLQQHHHLQNHHLQ
jgi:hypothetical protein